MPTLNLQSEDDNELYQIITGFYKRYGVGKLGLNNACRISTDNKSGFLCPITMTSDMLLDDLVGYESQKKELINNIEALLKGTGQIMFFYMVMQVLVNPQV